MIHNAFSCLLLQNSACGRALIHHLFEQVKKRYIFSAKNSRVLDIKVMKIEERPVENTNCSLEQFYKTKKVRDESEYEVKMFFFSLSCFGIMRAIWMGGKAWKKGLISTVQERLALLSHLKLLLLILKNTKFWLLLANINFNSTPFC